MRSVAGFSLTLASLFLAVVAVLIQSPALFYMGTALFVLILGSNLQAFLAVRGLKFERLPVGSVRVGDLVTVEVNVTSEHKIRRPLVTIVDRLPAKMKNAHPTPSLPIAPGYDLPVSTMYQFRANRRGRYRWSGLTAVGSDALGLVVKQHRYETEPVTLTVVPRPIPVNLDLPMASGWGISEAESGQTRGAGIEPRGIREYTFGDSLRHVHWPSTARTGKLLVKEFEAGTHAAAAFLIQRQKGTEVQGKVLSSLDLMSGHSLFLAEIFLKQGAKVTFPGLDDGTASGVPSERAAEIAETLAVMTDDIDNSLAVDVLNTIPELPMGSVVFALLTVADPDLPSAIATAAGRGVTICPLIYDANAMDAKFRGKNAADADYIRILRGVGSSPILMPTHEEVVANA